MKGSWRLWEKDTTWEWRESKKRASPPSVTLGEVTRRGDPFRGTGHATKCSIPHRKEVVELGIR